MQRQLQQAQRANSAVSEAERARQQQTLRQAEAREQARREQAEVERQRQRLQAQHLATMDVSQLLKKVRELQQKIDQVESQVRSEINRQIQPYLEQGKTSVAAKDEFETQAMYQQRLQKARQGDRIAEERYQREVAQIREGIENEIKARSQGYQEALSLLNRELVLDERQVELSLGGYDAERQVFAEIKLSLNNWISQVISIKE